MSIYCPISQRYIRDVDCLKCVWYQEDECVKRLVDEVKKRSLSKREFWHALGYTARHPSNYAKIDRLLEGKESLTRKQIENLKKYLMT